MKRSTTTSPPNERNLEILRGRDGRDGRDGLSDPRGIVGPPGPKGDTGDPGPKGERGAGVVYVHWGHDSCPDGGAQLVYASRAGGPSHTHRGGGANPQCLPLSPQNFDNIPSGAAQNDGFMYGAEYQHTNGLVSNSQEPDVPCAVCYVPTRNALYMIPGKYTCPSGWTREYFGFLMSEHHANHRSQFSCIDYSLTGVIRSSHYHNGFLFYPVEGVRGSLPCPLYTGGKELSCAVRTK